MIINAGTESKYRSIMYLIIERKKESEFLLKLSQSDNTRRTSVLGVSNIIEINKETTESDINPIQILFENDGTTMIDELINVIYFPCELKKRLVIITNASLYVRVNDLKYSKKTQSIIEPIVCLVVENRFLTTHKNQLITYEMVPFLYKMLVFSTTLNKIRKAQEIRALISKDQQKKGGKKEQTDIDLFYFGERIAEQNHYFFNMCVIFKTICDKLRTLIFIELFSKTRAPQLIFTNELSSIIKDQISYCRGISEFRITELNPNIRFQCKDLGLASYVSLVGELAYSTLYRPEKGEYEKQVPIPTKTMIIKVLYNCSSEEYLARMICECNVEMMMINRNKYIPYCLLVNIDLNDIDINLDTSDIKQFSKKINAYFPRIYILKVDIDAVISIIDDRNHLSTTSEHRKKTASLANAFLNVEEVEDK